MNILIIAILLACLQLVHALLEHYDSKKNKRIHLLKRHVTDYYLDWIFVPFNFLLLYSVSFNINILLIVSALAFLGNLIVHYYWFRIHTRLEASSYMFDSKKNKIHFSGYVHFLFSIIETILIIMFFFSSIISSLVYIEAILLLIYFSFLVIQSKKVNNGRFEYSDLVVCIVGIAALIVKIFI